MAKPKKKLKRAPIADKASTKIKKNPLAEYREAIQKTGTAEILALSDDDCLSAIRRHISTLSIALDKLLNGWGVPCGRVTEINGPSHIGKSTILDHLFASVQREKGVAVLIDTETSRDKMYTGRLGVDVSALQCIEYKKRHASMEAILDTIWTTITFWRDNHFDTPVLIGWDALGSTSTEEEMASGFLEKNSPALAARVMRLAGRQIPYALGGTNIALVILNHEYTTFGGQSFGGVKKKETYGGDGVKIASSIRMQLYGSSDPYVKLSTGQIIGREVVAKLVKNRFGLSPVETKIQFVEGAGINNVIPLYEDLKEKKIIVVEGSWGALNLNGQIYKFQGWRGLQELCATTPDLFGQLVTLYRS